ncbi:MAG TPA: nucleotidyltransferase domain-containing protein [archaeon]|nr:nucleotidyltransferase domain-containing protein [archaeon]
MQMLRVIDTDSKTKLLNYLLERPNSSFSVSELGRLSDLPKASVSNIVSEWEQIGLVESKWQGRNKLVVLNSNFYLLPELKKIFKKTKDFQKPLLKELGLMHALKSHNVVAIIAFGSRMRNDYTNSSDLDVLIVLKEKKSGISEKIVEGFVQASAKTGIRFSPLLIDKEDFQNRLKEKDKLLSNILAEGKVLKGGSWIGSVQASS